MTLLLESPNFSNPCLHPDKCLGSLKQVAPIGASPRLIGAYNCRWKFILVDYDIYIHCVYTPYLLYIVFIFFSTDGCVLSCISHFFKAVKMISVLLSLQFIMLMREYSLSKIEVRSLWATLSKRFVFWCIFLFNYLLSSALSLKWSFSLFLCIKFILV